MRDAESRSNSLTRRDAMTVAATSSFPLELRDLGTPIFGVSQEATQESERYPGKQTDDKSVLNLTGSSGADDVL